VTTRQATNKHGIQQGNQQASMQACRHFMKASSNKNKALACPAHVYV
jgi:hypothetical protein